MSERGSASVELVIIVPGLLLIIGLLVAGGRVWSARAAVAEAAHGAARAASLERTPGAATARAHLRINEGLREIPCVDLVVTADTSGFSVRVGEPARVQVDVVCRVPLRDLVGLPVAYAVEARGHGIAALDTYRGRR